MDNELLLFDRVEIIKTANAKYDLEHNAYLSFSGGKDSTILHYLIDMALPNNKSPRVFFDTGIEYLAIRRFVMSLAEKDPRFVIIKPTKPIKAVLEKYGYPFKSKEFSHIYGVWQRSGKTMTVLKFLQEYDSGANNRVIVCPASLKPLFTEKGKIPFKVDDLCCKKLKKDTAARFAKESGRAIAVTGMRAAEGGQRMRIDSCILTDAEGHLKKFHPLIKVNDEWEDWFIEHENIELCELYKPPFNFKRTGCKFCPFSLDLEEQLEIAYRYMPAEAAQAELIWKPVFDEYRRLGYRLHKQMQIKLDI